MEMGSEKMTKAPIVLALILGLTLAGAAFPQQPPGENKGMSATQLAGFDLGKQGLKDLDQRQMRMRLIIVEPGGAAAFHSHAQRPALTYVLKGSLLEHRKGSADRTYNAGEVIVETTDVDHWAENKGPETTTLVSVDLFKE
jgi:quercetin dioxygenase-like cupin family protein